MRRWKFQSKGIAMVLGSGLLVAACGGESAWVPASGPTQVVAGGRPPVWVREASEVSTQGRATIYPLELGSKAPMLAGRTLGYELISTTPGTYRFRWTGDSFVSHVENWKFQGSVWTAGHFTSVVPGCADRSCALEDDDYLSAVQHVAGGERIDWDTNASIGWDGFSFTTDTEPLYIELNVDGEARPDLLEFLAAGRPSGSGVLVGGLPAPFGG